MNRKSRKESEDNAVILKSKVKDLENEVVELKKRLEDLRRAKSNTILKREREVIQVGGPNLGRPAGVETSKYKELERKLHESESKNKELQLQCQEIEKDRNEWKINFENLKIEMNSLKDAHEIKIAEISNECREHKAKANDLSIDLERLRERLEVKSMHEENKKRENNQRESYIADLINENTTLRVKNEQLFIQLSEKEAMWLQNKELMIKKIQEKWDEKYARWMSETEKKIEDLRAANLILKQCLVKRDERTSHQENPSTSGAPDQQKEK